MSCYDKKMKKSVDISFFFDIIFLFADERTDKSDADWCNGSTADSDSVSRGSSPLSVVFGVWLSLVERYVRDVEAAGSNPVTPITGKVGRMLRLVYFFAQICKNQIREYLKALN